jgi:RNA polymerase sigma-70 factor (ECF subfamily)
MKEKFVQIVNENQGIIYKVSKMYRDTKEDQEDLFQEIVLQLWKAYPKFRGESKVSTWIYRIALNASIATFRKNKIVIDYIEKIPDTEIHSKEKETSNNEEKMFIALRKLKDVEKAIISLYLEGYSHKEIAELIGITENYVGVKFNRIKNRLIKLLKI